MSEVKEQIQLISKQIIQHILEVMKSGETRTVIFQDVKMTIEKMEGKEIQ